VLELGVDDQANVAEEGVFRVEVEARELSVDLFDKLKELILGDEDQRFGRVIGGPEIESVSLSVDVVE
jgi:hypothetical protein